MPESTGVRMLVHAGDLAVFRTDMESLSEVISLTKSSLLLYAKVPVGAVFAKIIFKYHCSITETLLVIGTSWLHD